MLTRRQTIQFLASSAAMSAVGPSFAVTGPTRRPRLAVIILRGGMDGLAAVAPYGDPNYRRNRGKLALEQPGSTDGLLDLDGTFGLHPNLKSLHKLHQEGSLITFHALASPYRGRSHFSGQDVLENGTVSDSGARDGWLSRVVASLPASGNEKAIAVGGGIPLILRGASGVTSWAPSQLPSPDENTLERIATLYASDTVLGPALQKALTANDIADASLGEREAGRSARARDGSQRFATMMSAAGRFLASDTGPQIATLELSGWDTHANQGARNGRLARQLSMLDGGITALRVALGSAWSDTAVFVASEFGRTVAINGTGGTDHGTAGAAFLVGGAVKGGRVVSDWPGLAHRDLYEGRDLRSTLDVRAVAKGLLQDQFNISTGVLGTSVFPDSRHISPLEGLIRV